MYETFEGERGGTFCLSRAGLAEGTNANTYKTLAPNGAGIDYCIDGILYHLAEGDNIAMTALAQQAAKTTCLYVIQVNAAGTLTLKKGVEQLNTDIDAGNAVIDWPLPDALNCAIGYMKIKTANSVTYTAGSVDLSATDVTATFYNVVRPPVRPLTS